MNYPFERHNSQTFRRIMSISAVIVLSAAVLSGCKRIDVPDSSANNNTPPNLVDNTLPAASTEATQPTSTEETKPIEEAAPNNMATVKEQVNTLASPSKESKVITQLDAGDQVEVDRVETLRGVSWAHIPEKGWLITDYLDMTNVPIANAGSTSTPANPEATEPSANTATDKPANGKMGVVTGNELNIRSEASTNGEIKGQLNHGDRVTVTETSNGWGKIKDGWINLNYVYMDGDKGANPCKGLVSGSQLNVRSGPGTDYASVSTLNEGTRVQVLEQIKIGNATWGCTKDGWISMDYIYVDGTTGEGSGTGTVTGTGVNIRSGPGTAYDVVASATSGDTLKIYAQFTFGDMKWGCTDKGWISMNYVDME